MSSNQIVIKSQFLTSLFELPLVVTAIDFSSRTYQSTKLSNVLFNKSFSAVEDTALFVVNNSKPIICFFERPARAVGVVQALSAADTMAAKVLKDAKATVLFINKPTGQVFQEVKDYMETITSRVTVIVSPVTSQVELVHVFITDRLGSSYSGLHDLFALTKGQLQSTVTVLLQLISFSDLMNSMHYYVNDVQTRRSIIAGLKLADDSPASAEGFVTLESLDEGYSFGTHFIYAKAINSILTLEYTLSSSTSCVLSVLKYHSSWKKQGAIADSASNSALPEGEAESQGEHRHGE